MKCCEKLRSLREHLALVQKDLRECHKEISVRKQQLSMVEKSVTAVSGELQFKEGGIRSAKILLEECCKEIQVKESKLELIKMSMEDHSARLSAEEEKLSSVMRNAECQTKELTSKEKVEAAVRATGEYPERPGEPPCQFYLKSGTCKFGASCKFHHPKHGGGSMSHVPLNTDGYPLRPGEKECFYYLKTGQCKFGITCKSHHPQPAGTSMPASAPQFYQPVQSSSVPIPDQYGGASASLRVRPPLLPGSCVQGTFGPVLFPPGVVPIPGWNPYSAPVSPVLSPGAGPAVRPTSLYGVSQFTSSTPALAGSYHSLPSPAGPSINSQKDQTFPERPGEPECQYYLRTGDCKFGSSCRYHHPRDRVLPRTNCLLGPLGLPLRPGVQPCTFYLQNGRCKFGSTCKFDHPIGALRYSPSASSSLIDIPVAPYQVGSLLATLAPSPPSPEVRPEFFPGAKMEPYLTVIPPLANTLSSSGGLIFSQPGSVQLSELQLSGQSSVPLTSGRSTRQGGEVRRSN